VVQKEEVALIGRQRSPFLYGLSVWNIDRATKQ